MDNSKKKYFRTFASSVRGVYSRNGWRSQWELFLLHEKWDRIAGNKISKITRPAFFRNNTLYLYVDNSSWMHQIHFLTGNLLQAVNNVLEEKKIDAIQLLLKPWEPPLTTENKYLPDDEDVDQSSCQEMQQLMGYIEDEECRKSLYNLWYRSKLRSRNIKTFKI